MKVIRRHRLFANATAWGLLAGAVASAVGCQDGPMYALKHVNPYFAMREWKDDSELGITDHQRREELLKLTQTIASVPLERQQYWIAELQKIMRHDPSAEMRRLAVNAAGRISDQVSLALVEAGLDDESIKVQMEACRALGRRTEAQATQLLASTVGTSTEDDVRNAAIAALGQHSSEVAVDALKLALRNRDPAVRQLAIGSLKGTTGKDYGNDPQVWIAALNGETVPEQPSGPFGNFF